MVSHRSPTPPAAARQQSAVAGPWGWENARAKLAGQPWAGALEVACYTDALRLDGQVTSGPYNAMVPLAYHSCLDRVGEPSKGVVIRLERHVRGDDPDEYIDDTWFQQASDVAHGGDAGEELAALLSLVLGIRLRAGGILRVFHPSDEDERGFPHEPGRPAPYLPPRTREPMLPYTTQRPADLSSARSLLDIYPRISAKQARALVRSARSYQVALWIADSDPRLAWLRLVTAIESAAQLSTSGPAAQTLTSAPPRDSTAAHRRRRPRTDAHDHGETCRSESRHRKASRVPANPLPARAPPAPHPGLAYRLAAYP